ncbi:hypothetical protein ACWT_6585 [Actinoplanes sp. SE50]|uniref:DUF6220 domain-containing protein n=1 Tax=unclassified Actinoplanes TaxID=2626549 RepID=UPI00023EC6C2|nr:MULTISPECIES: DUF6220 domain-containing protein [unclassified Actinoplanes]AEV87597.1 hypothetical protein ACPL_6715 [Actinoplanes sp. SE50/110]ATO86000.1 hypothetical protein ACWT_6585 [Actinoplanes sp. SE50]SLM03414.1 uncharacterized protein ACSP50_6703 [Actinoplanes sp. SE50/110]
MRALYRALAGLIALSVVVQAAVLAAAWFIVIKDTDNGVVFDKNNEGNWGHAAHGIIGMMVVPLLALLLLIISFFARIPGGVKWALITVGVVALQIVLAMVSFGVPVIGALHGINAFAVAGVASIAMRQARESIAPPVAVA